LLKNLELVDIIALVLLLLSMPVAGVWVSWYKNKAEDYFMAGYSLRWWAVAGSVIGTNVSTSQLIGMLGVGYSVGFAQSHFEILAVAAILLLAYVFLPAYQKLGVFTLSEYLEHRYDHYTRLAYTILMVLLIGVQMIAAFYIGSRTLMLLSSGTSFEVTYFQGVFMIAMLACTYTTFGGLGAVVIVDSLQTVMMLVAGILVAIFTFSQPEIGGFLGLLDLEKHLPAETRKMHLYLPSSNKDLPWTGVFTGLMILHFFYWITNQYLVQRTLAAKNEVESRIGLMVAGFLKLSIPFFSISTGVAAYHIFRARFGASFVLPDDAFLRLVEMVIPLGYGFLGLILAGLTAATFSSVDSMMNSASTLITLDIYKRHLYPGATDQQMVRFGRVVTFSLVLTCAYLALVSYDPKSAGNFFLVVSSRGSYFTPGIVSIFFVGIFWRRAHSMAALITLLVAPFFAYGMEQWYDHYLSAFPEIRRVWGIRLNFLHRVFLTVVFSSVLLIVLSYTFKRREISQNQPKIEIYSLHFLMQKLYVFFGIQLLAMALIYMQLASPQILAIWIGLATFLQFLVNIYTYPSDRKYSIFQEDRLYAGFLSGCAMYMLYFFA